MPHWYSRGIGRPLWKKDLKIRIQVERVKVEVPRLDTSHNLRRRLKRCKIRAARMSIRWELHDAHALALLTRGLCHYCCRTVTTDALSLKDPALGYISGNVVSCCDLCERTRGNYSYEDFLSLAKQQASLFVNP